MTVDLIVTNATIVDGSGGEPFVGGVAVKKGEISAVWRAGASDVPQADAAARVVDAMGKLVTPGFVDVHSHSDFNLLIDPNAESKLWQGVTTEIVGNCGMSAFPMNDLMRSEEWEILPRRGLDLDWDSPAHYFERLEEAGPAVNVASFAGHGNVRGVAMGFADREADSREMRAMEGLVEQAMEAGAMGLSTGLIYAPGMFASTDEIVALQRVAARRGGIYASHVRGEGDSLAKAADEFFNVVERVDCQAQYSHLKASGRRNWGKVAGIIERVEKTNERGGMIRFDKYPYTASSTELSTLLPRWGRAGGHVECVTLLQDPGSRAKLEKELREDYADREPWGEILLVDAGCAEYRGFEGNRLSDVARLTDRDGMNLFFDLLVRSRMGATISNFTMSADETDAAILHPLGMVCSDAECRCTEGPLSEGAPHPRAYGAFPKFFRDYVKERPLMTLPAAVAKVTSLPCEVFGFKRRGLIREGYFADLLMLDWDRFEDRATFPEPHQYATGVEMVVVGGVVEILNGKLTGERGGCVLRRV